MDGEQRYVLDWGPIFHYQDGPQVSESDKAQITFVIQKQLLQNQMLAEVQRVKIIGYVRPGQRAVHIDQRFSASCSTSISGVYDVPVVLLICHSQQEGWYVVLCSMKPNKRTTKPG